MTRAIKRRRTREELHAVRDEIIRVLGEDRPQSVRHLFYRLASSLPQIIGKDETGYRVVQRETLRLREANAISWSWISDGTRWRRVSDSFNDIAEAIRHTAETYRKDLWRRTPAYVEVWCESDSIAGVLFQETDRYNVPLMVSRGFSSRTYLHNAAQAIKNQSRPAYLYYIGDYDPSGVMIPEKIEAGLRAFAPDAEIAFRRLLVNPDQIEDWDLPTKPAKRTTHAKSFRGGTVEAEAVPASLTRQILRQAIESHLDLREVEAMRVAEQSESELLKSIADRFEAA